MCLNICPQCKLVGDVLDVCDGWDEDRGQQNEVLELVSAAGVLGQHVPLPGCVWEEAVCVEGWMGEPGH